MAARGNWLRPVDRRGPSPLREQIAAMVVDRIRSGAVRSGDPLPSSRALASALGVARSTVVGCFLQLEGDGWLESRPGSGTFIATGLTQFAEVPMCAKGDAQPVASEFDLHPGRVDPGLTSSRAWRAAWRQEFAAAHPSPAMGEAALREQIARHLVSARRMPAHAAEIVVCSAIAEALTVLGFALEWRGRTVVVEDPCYPRVRAVLTRLGVTVLPVPASDSAGFVARVTSMRIAPTAVYVTPRYQYPLGHRMAAVERATLLDWAATTGTVIVEDDYDSEHRSGVAADDPMAAVRSGADIAYFGSLATSLDPALRLGYLRVSSALIPAVEAVRCDLGTSTPRAVQLVAARLLATGELSRHVARTSRIYGDRRAAAVGALRRMPHVVDVRAEQAGLHLVAMLRRHVATTAVVAQAAARGVALRDLDSYRAESRPDAPGLVVGFARHSPMELREALTRVASVPELRL